jgi:hypothetical protein
MEKRKRKKVDREGDKRAHKLLGRKEASLSFLQRFPLVEGCHKYCM